MKMRTHHSSVTSEKMASEVITSNDAILCIGAGSTAVQVVAEIRRQLKSRASKTPYIVEAFDSDIDASSSMAFEDVNIANHFSRGWSIGKHFEQAIENCTDHKFKRELIHLLDRVPNAVKSKSDTDGAAQTPAFSQLMLFNALNNVNNDFDTLLRTAANKFYTRTNDVSKQKPKRIRVLLVTSSAGGTGSGTCLTLGLVIRKWMKDNNINGFVDILCMMPDLFSGKQSAFEVENARARTYAFFKEINYLNIPPDTERKDKFEFRPGMLFEDLKLDSVIDNVILVDGSRDDGEKIASLEAGINYCADLAMVHIFGSVGNRYISKSDNVTRARAAAESAGDSRKYSTSGLGKISYPVDHVKEYISVNLISQLFKSDWVFMDNRFREAVRDWMLKQQNGVAQAEKPDRGEHFIMTLESMQRENPSFKTIYKSVMVSKIDEESGVERVENIMNTYLSALHQHVEKEFQQNDYYQTFNQMTRQNPMDKLGVGYSLEQVASNVGRDANNLERLGIKILQSQPESTLSSVFKTAETSPQAKPYYIQTYIRNLHPNAVRYFLYLLREHINQLNKEAESAMEAARKTLEACEKIFEGNSANMQLRELERSPIGAFFSRGKKKLIAELERYSHDTSFAQKKLVTAEFDHKFYAYVLQHVSQLISYYEELADGVLDTLLDELALYSDKLEEKYASGNRHDDCVNYVGARAEVLQALRDRIIGQASAQPGGNESVFANYNEFILQHHYDMQEVWQTAAEGYRSSKLMSHFRDNIVEGELAEYVIEEYGHYFDFDVCQAIQEEANALGYDPKDYLSISLQQLVTSSLPYLKCRHQEELKNDFALLLVTEQVLAALPDKSMLSEQLKLEAMDIMALDEFSPYELNLVNMRLGLSLQNVTELHPDGRYYKAFDDVNTKVMQNLYTNAGKLAEQPIFSRAHWSVPGFIPEPFPELNDEYVYHSHFSLLLAYVNDLAKWKNLLTNNVLTINGVKVASSTDWDECARELMKRPDLIAAMEKLKPHTIKAVPFEELTKLSTLEKLTTSRHYQIILRVWFDLIMECCSERRKTQLEASELAVSLTEQAENIAADMTEKGAEEMQIERITASYNELRAKWLEDVQDKLDLDSERGLLA